MSNFQFLISNEILNSKLEILTSIFSHEPDLVQDLIKFLKKYRFPKFDCLAFTVGPGLAPALWVGVNFARALSVLFDLPLVPVNHLKGHIYGNWLNQKSSFNPFPAMALLISGGHTQLILVNKDHEFKIVGETRDDAVGEAYDKIAKFLGLPYPGGPIIEKLAEAGDSKFFDFPRPMIKQKNCDFSFSGLKTSVLYTLKNLPTTNYQLPTKRNIAASFQQAVVDVLVFKTIKAVKQSDIKIKSLMVGGGVAANKKINQELLKAVKKELPKIKVYFAPKGVITDNALMIAMAGYFNYLKKKTIDWHEVKALPNLRIDESKV
ncbi:tRNA (adenosine(37)-N6)-threonylcarbamoyltransferase complex transferase subunit TsaD [Candidatus Azambacteria bacterium]|nr:tRNA (adenosine(37)-N6)-threonylcarbamoyltransferase complex transferase subunit TsaD [Candidatus Azambacteria bacterium]